MNNYNRTNNLLGWLAFIIASVTYILTLEPSSSFWDCGEFIACIYKMQVAHQPGAPLFTMIGKVFSLLSMGDRTKVAYWTNIASALASGATILFLFWSITALAKKILIKTAEDFTQTNLILIMGAGLVGALAYTFSDTFWFSAVESEVYAQSSLCTAIVFWAILKYDAHADEPGSDRWIVFIAYIMGLSIGVHLLNLLVTPAIALVIYFRRAKTATARGVIGSVVLGVIILGLILWGIIQFTVKGAAYSDLLFVNTLHFGFGSGSTAFYVLIVAMLVAGIYYSVTTSKPALITAMVCLLLALTFSAGIIGLIAGIAILAFLEYVLKVRNHRYAINLVLICTLFILFGYSSFVMIPIRAKAGTNLNNSDPRDAFALNSYLNRDQYGETPLLYGQYFDAQRVDDNVGNNIYRRGKTQYEVAGKKTTPVYDHNTIFPRIFDTDPSGQKQNFYRDWLQLGKDDKPGFGDNLKFFFSWQVYQMYFRYFMWNFAGRTNEMDGQNNSNGIDGNWIGPRDLFKKYPSTVTLSKSYNRMYFLPLIIGLLGLFYHFKKDSKDASVVALLFFFTGLAIVLYLNQNPLQPRERDYAYAGSFYVFAIWIGMGVLFIADLLRKTINPKTGAVLATVVCLLAAPALMASQEWNDHDRSTKLTPHDMAYNYLTSCAPNAILFTYGDNDTYPLWYIQEVENVRPDVRIVNLSLLGTDWYIRQMKQQMNASAPLPISMPDEKFEAGVRDVIYFDDAHISTPTNLKEVFDFLTSDATKKQSPYTGSVENYLPTKDFKLTINPDEVVQTGTVPASQKSLIDTAMVWKYNSNYVTKDNLAMIDILAHNNWKRPIYFAITVGSENMMGMDKYMHDEGFAYRLEPLKPDTAATAGGGEATNTMTMYHNIMDKFKWGNMKNAKYLDHESLTMFYPIIMRQFNTLISNLTKEGHPDLARNVLKKYDEVMPSSFPEGEVALRKYYLTENAYQLGQTQLATKWTNQLDAFATNTLDFNATALDSPEEFNQRDVQVCLYILSNLVNLTKNSHQAALSAKLAKQVSEYESKFAGVMSAPNAQGGGQ